MALCRVGTLAALSQGLSGMNHPMDAGHLPPLQLFPVVAFYWVLLCYPASATALTSSTLGAAFPCMTLAAALRELSKLCAIGHASRATYSLRRRQKHTIPRGNGRRWLLPIGWVGRLGAIGGWCCVGSLGGGNRGGAGVVGGRAVPLDGLTVRWGGSWGRVTCNKPQPHHQTSAASLDMLRSIPFLFVGVAELRNSTAAETSRVA